MYTLGMLFLLLLVESSQLQPSSTPSPCDLEFKTAIGKLILSSMENATVFLEKNMGNLNLSSMWSFRVIEVQLRAVQRTWAKDHLLQPLSQHAKNLFKKLLLLFGKYISYLLLIKHPKLQEIDPLIHVLFWKLPKAWTHTNASMVNQSSQFPVSLSQEHIASCIVDLLKTRCNKGHCQYSNICKNHVTIPHGSGHYLSYQLYYFLLSRMMGCTKKQFKHTQHYMDLFCSNMMDTNQKIEAIGYPWDSQDLFMENIKLCGLGGYSDFYKLHWLKDILSWQDPQEGCFGTPDGCDIRYTILALEALGGFIYILAEYPQVFASPPQFTPQSNASLSNTNGSMHIVPR